MTQVPADPARTLESPAQAHSATDVAARFLLAHQGSTRASYGQDLRSWFSWCQSRDLDPLTASRAHVDTYARTLAEVPDSKGRIRSPATVARHLSTLSSYYHYAVDEDVITRNPVAKVRRPKVGTDTVSTGLDRDELATFIHAAEADSPRSLALVLLLGLNGLRISEALGADITDLGTERGHRVLVVTRKGGRRATVPFAARTASALDDYVGERTAGPLFVTRNGLRWHRSEAWRVLRRLARNAVPGKANSLHPHDLRHAFVTLSLDAGASLRDVQDAAGHADPRTTRRYDRTRQNLDRHPTFALAGLFAFVGAGQERAGTSNTGRGGLEQR